MTPQQVEQGKGDFPLELLMDINTKRMDIADQFRAEEDRYRAEIARLNKEVEENQARCPHPKAFCEYVPDPWHSYYVCELCGKEEVRPR